MSDIGEDKNLVETWVVLQPNKCEKFKCKKCENSTSFHPLFIKHDSAGCIRCEEIETIAKRMLEQRGYIFVSIRYDFEKKYHYITFKCKSGHTTTRPWRELKAGGGCRECNKQIITKPKKEPTNREEIFVAPKCDCKSLNKGMYRGSSYICEHYNFAVACPEALKFWCYDLNEGMDPHTMAPGSHQKAYFRCDKYNEVYQKILKVIYSEGLGCPYCFGTKVCVGNSLATTHPELVKFWHPDNEIKPTEIKAGSHIEVWWLCDKNNAEHKYKRTPHIQTSKHHNFGCPQCGKSYAQKTGGFEHFVEVCSDVHNGKYHYPQQEFAGMSSQVNVYCPEVSEKSGQIHGLFTPTASNHKRGSGCPKCANEKIDSFGVQTIKEILNSWECKEDVHYICEQKLKGLKDKASLRIDFYFKANVCGNKYPFAVEFDHSQHFYHGKSEWNSVEDNKRRDLIKDLFCVQNQISMIRIPYVHKITPEYLAGLINKCTNVQCYFSYLHYEREIRKKVNLGDVLVETVKLPARFDDITCSLDN